MPITELTLIKKHETESEDEREKDVYIYKIKKKQNYKKTKKQFENYKQITQAELKEKDSEIAKLTKLNLFLQTSNKK